MIEIYGDAWKLSQGQNLCITTNGFVKKNGCAVMGRGIAQQAAIRFPKLPLLLGDIIKQFGNTVMSLGKHGDWFLISFPVKHNWFEKADEVLIAQSVEKLARLWSDSIHDVFLPRPGCGNGQLKWEDVRPLLISLDDKFKIVTFRE